MYSRRPAALTRPEAGIRYGRRPAALARTHAAGRPHMRAEHAILISCEHSLLAGEAWFETIVCIRRENSCTHDMPHASIPARGARGSDGGGRGAKKE